MNPPPERAPGAIGLSSGLLDSWLDGWSATVSGLSALFTATLAGRIDPLDLAHGFVLASARRPPSWATPHELVFETPIARLRDFSTSEEEHGPVPTLVLPPQAGHDSCIVDYSAEQSQIRTILNCGLSRAMSLDWIGASPETADTSVEDYLEVVDRAVEHCGGKVNLIGDCQGGWLATIYAALNPERVNTLTLAGAPVDFHAGEPVIHELLQRLEPTGDLYFYEALVAAGGGVLKGEHMLSGFIAIKPSDEISRQFELLQHVRDPARVARYQEFENWFKHTQDIPGAFYLWIVRHLFRDNELVGGSLRVGGQLVALSAIDMPLNLLAGATDHITPPDQAFAIARHASTPRELIRHDVTPGGHLGLFMGHQALREHWPPLLAEVLRHSAAS
jgi:poly(3-hydroxyalkanoate) synthetase